MAKRWAEGLGSSGLSLLGAPGLTAADMEKCAWVRPQLVVRIEFLEWTESNHLRHSKFAGLREDKDARTVIKEHGGERAASAFLA